MFSRTRTTPSTSASSGQIDRLRRALRDADAVLVGAGAGLSTAAGFTYSGERFQRYFWDFAAKYGIRDMYSGGFYPFPAPEEFWAYWSRYILLNRYQDPPKPIYQDLRRLLAGKTHISGAARRGLWCLGAAALLWSAVTISPPTVTAGGLTVFRGILTGLLHPDWSLLWNFSKQGVPYLCLETLAMTVAGTAIGAVVSVPIALSGSRNISGPWRAGVWKLLLLALRTLPAIVTGLLFIRVTGPGSFAGLLTLAVLSVSMCCKLYIGALDAMDLGAVRAMEAMGCGRLAVLRQGVWPQAKGPILSAALYRFDVNLREAAVLGLVGAGGLGTPLLFAMNGYLWSQAAAYLLGLLVLVLAAGAMADRSRRKTM